MLNISTKTVAIVFAFVFVIWLIFLILYRYFVKGPVFVDVNANSCDSEAAHKKYCGDDKDCCLFWYTQSDHWFDSAVIKQGCIKGYKFLGSCSDKKPIYTLLIVIPFAIISAILFALIIMSIFVWISWTRKQSKGKSVRRK